MSVTIEGHEIDLKKARRWHCMTKLDKCYMCKKKMKVIKSYPKQFKHLSEFLDGGFLFHMKDTHGFPPEIVIDNLLTCLKEERNG